MCFCKIGLGWLPPEADPELRILIKVIGLANDPKKSVGTGS